MPTTSRPLTASEVSEMTGVCHATLRYYRHLGIGPRSFKLGRRVVYDVQDVKAWIAAQKKATSSGGVVQHDGRVES